MATKKGQKLYALIILAGSITFMAMVASGDFEFEYGIFGWIGSIAGIIYSLVVLLSPSEKKEERTKQKRYNQRSKIHSEKILAIPPANNLSESATVAIGSSIPKEWIETGKRNIAKESQIAPENTLFFYNADGQAKLGIMTTATHWYSHLKASKENDETCYNSIALHEIKTANITDNLLYVNNIAIGVLDHPIAGKVNDLIRIIVDVNGTEESSENQKSLKKRTRRIWINRLSLIVFILSFGFMIGDNISDNISMPIDFASTGAISLIVFFVTLIQRFIMRSRYGKYKEHKATVI